MGTNHSRIVQSSTVQPGTVRHSRKRQSIRQKITMPFLIVAVIVPLAALIVFNVGMRFYLLQTARNDLKTTAAVMDTLIRQQALNEPGGDAGATLSAAIKERLNSLRTAMRATRLSATTDLLVMDKDGNVILPADPSSLGLNEVIIKRIYRRVSADLKPGTTANIIPANSAVASALITTTVKVQSLWTGQGHYLFVGEQLFPKAPNRTPIVVYLTKVSLFSGFMLFINLLLIGIFIVGSVVSMVIARKTAASIEQPVQMLNQFAERIGHGDFTPETASTTCRDLIELADQMNSMAARLKDADTMQTTFLQNASHEIRTPLMSILGYAEGLRSGIITDTQRAAGIIHDEGLRLKTLVEELLTLSRIENRSVQLELVRQNLPDVIRETVARFQVLAQKESKEILLQIDYEPLNVRLDDDLLTQAVTNLLTNAIRYASRAITVFVSEDQNQAVVRVEDDGPGLPAGAIPRLFERFYKGPGGQFGLGLSIALSAVTALHGTLTAANRTPPPGAVFEIRLPIDR